MHWCSPSVDLVQGQDGRIEAIIRHSVLQLHTTDEVMKSFPEHHLLYYWVVGFFLIGS